LKKPHPLYLANLRACMLEYKGCKHAFWKHITHFEREKREHCSLKTEYKAD